MLHFRSSHILIYFVCYIFFVADYLCGGNSFKYYILALGQLTYYPIDMASNHLKLPPHIIDIVDNVDMSNNVHDNNDNDVLTHIDPDRYIDKKNHFFLTNKV